MAIERFAYKKNNPIDRSVFFRLPKFLFEYKSLSRLSTEAKVLYGKFLELVEFSVRAGWYDDEDRLYIRYTLKSVERFFDCSNHKARDIFKELGDEGVGLITRVDQGRGKPSIIYVHKFIPEYEDLKDEYKKNYAEKNYTSAEKEYVSAQKNSVYYSKSTPNNNSNKVIYKDFNNTNPYNYSMDDYEKKYTEGGGSL